MSRHEYPLTCCDSDCAGGIVEAARRKPVGNMAAKLEAESIERIIRDAIIDYQGMYASAPNDEAERELVERATTANNWLVSHGFAPEKTIWDKEESPCL